ncbi:MAG: hypothetical protein AAGB51_03190 [Planctomycetota bacterium]
MNKPTTILIASITGSVCTACAFAGPDFSGPGLSGQPDPRRIFALDEDNSGTLDAAELAALKARIMETATERAGPRIDTNGDGEIDAAELATFEASVDKRLSDIAARFEQMYPEALNRFDRNGDGIIAEDELPAARGQRRGARRGGPPSPIRLLRLDEDKSGTLDEDELAEVKDAMGERLSFIAERYAEAYPRILERLDADGDGAISSDEIPERPDRHRGAGRHNRAIERFDLNGDGAIDQAERANARQEVRADLRRFRAIRQLDANASRSIDDEELANGLAKVAEGDPSADYNGDGEVNSLDADALIEHVQNPPERPRGRRGFRGVSA